MHWYSDYFSSPLWVSKPALFFVFVLCVVLAIPFWKVWKWQRQYVGRLTFSYFTFVLLVVWMFLGDAYKASLRYNKLCQQEAGMHIYRIVDNVESFASNSKTAAESSLTEGYRFAEYEYLYSGKLYRFTWDGTRSERGYVTGITEEEIDHLESKYYIHEEDKILSDQIKKKSIKIMIRENKEVLGEWVSFYYYPGWLDKKLWGWLGDYSPPICDGEKHVWDLYTTVLVPINK